MLYKSYFFPDVTVIGQLIGHCHMGLKERSCRECLKDRAVLQRVPEESPAAPSHEATCVLHILRHALKPQVFLLKKSKHEVTYHQFESL